MTKTARHKALIAFLTLSVTIAAVAGYLYWESALISLLALLAWSKKLFTLSGIWLLVKKLPFMLIIGGKKLIIKALGSLLLFSVRTRFPLIRTIILRLKLWTRRILQRSRYHWSDMEPWEKVIVYVSFIPLTCAAVLILLLFAFVPRYIRNLLMRKVQESTAASVIDRGFPGKARQAVAEVHSNAKNRIREKLIPEHDKVSSDRGNGSEKQL